MERKLAIRVTAYLIYGLILAGALILWRFPYQGLIQRLEGMASERLGLRLEMAAPSFTLPAGLSFSKLSLSSPEFGSEPLIDTSRGNLRLMVLPLLKRMLAFTFHTQAYSGSLRGEVHLAPLYDFRQYQLNVHWQGIKLERHSASSKLLGRQLSGEISGQFQLDGFFDDFAKSNGRGKLSLKDGICQVNSPYLSISELNGIEVTATVELAGRKLRISSCDFKASGLQGSLDGVVELKPRLSESTLGLAGRGRLDASLINLASPTGRGAMIILKENKPLPFHLRGTLAAPRLAVF